jgi:asparagine synthase (glutamine-hydrolysing)
VPFCDYRIAEYLYSVPWEYKNHMGREKGLLRKAVEGLLPQEILYRKKSPYPKTFDPRYEQLMWVRLTKLMEESDAPVWQLICLDAVKIMLEEQHEWPWYGQLMRRPQTIAYLLQLDFWFKHYQVEILF